MAAHVPEVPRLDDLSDEEVVERVRAGDGACYEILMRRHNRRVYRAVRAILDDEVEIEDVMQDAYLAAYSQLPAFEGRARFSTWLIRIAVNRALDRRRRAARVVALDAVREETLARAAAGGTPPQPDPEEQLDARALARRLEAAIGALPETYRAAYVLRELEGLPARDTASCLGIEEATVHTRVHRARRLLREALGDAVDVAAGRAFPFAGERCDRVVAGVMARIRERYSNSGR